MGSTGAFYRDLIRRLKVPGEPIGVYTDPDNHLKKGYLDHGETIETGIVEWFGRRPAAVICGGGHISLALCRILKLLDFHVTVIDDREEFANTQRFELADTVVCERFEQVFRTHRFDPGAYFVIVTRGHEFDYVCLQEISGLHSGYVGMIGSRGKVQKTMERLRQEDGVSEEWIASVKAPIGLSIGARTPEEIAVSIAAEMIEVKRRDKREVEYLDQSIAECLESGRTGVLMTVIEKKGSSPGKTGSRMFLDEGGIPCGTIGGGNLEHQALMDGWKCLSSRESGIVEYDLSSEAADRLGMICGGKIRVLFEMIEKEGTR
jgi:xanthine dehydrogenase accessory factor